MSHTIKVEDFFLSYKRDRPSCFSERVARVRRSNGLEERRLQTKLRAIHQEEEMRKYEIRNERKAIVKQLTGIRKIKDTSSLGLDRRRTPQSNVRKEILLTKQEKKNTMARKSGFQTNLEPTLISQ